MPLHTQHSQFNYAATAGVACLPEALTSGLTRLAQWRRSEARAVEGIAAQSCPGAHQQDTVADRSPEVQQAHIGKRGRLRVAAADNDQRVSSHGRGVREPPWRRLAPALDKETSKEPSARSQHSRC